MKTYMNNLLRFLGFSLLLNTLTLISASTPPFDPDCKGFPCPPPPCENPQMTTVIQEGKLCPGCPVCPPENDCEDLPACAANNCSEFICPTRHPTCGFESNQFCRGCDRCLTCDDITCPAPEGRCRKFEPLKLESGELCNNCRVCVDDFTHCPEISCPAFAPHCRRDKFKFNPIHLNGRICLGCTTCECPALTCKKCDRIDDKFEVIRDLAGCPTSCPACDIQFTGICSRIRCGRPAPECRKITYAKGPDGEVCSSCRQCADHLSVCKGFHCPALPKTCANKPLHYKVTVNGKECLSCPTCSDIPRCEPQICPACVPVDNWQSPTDVHGCPTQCPPCKVDPPLCPQLNTIWCSRQDYEEVQIGRRTCLGCPRR